MPMSVGVPENPAAEMRPDLIVAEPSEIEPGDLVALSFPDETARGILFTLDREALDGWRTLYFLTSDGPGPGWEPTWTRAGGAGLDVEAIGVGGIGPDPVPILDRRGRQLPDLHRQRRGRHLRTDPDRRPLTA